LTHTVCQYPRWDIGLSITRDTIKQQ